MQLVKNIVQFFRSQKRISSHKMFGRDIFLMIGIRTQLTNIYFHFNLSNNEWLFY